MSQNEQIARLIPLHQIRPDPAQPRQLLPPDLLATLGSGGSPFDILDQLRIRAEHDKWIRERLTELDALAHSIADDGLMNPIRVIAEGDERYRIEEGERRWWTHHILVQQGKEQYQTIPAFVVEPNSISSGLLRRRVAENVLRSEFTAIELARAMACRIQENLDAEPGIKRVEAESRVGKENGMSDRRVRQFVGLLKLAPETQELAQQARLTENSLRRIVSIKDTTKQLEAVRELMHPSRPRTAASSLQSRADRKLGHGTNPHSGRETRSKRISATSSRRNRSPHKDARSKERRSNKRSAMQNIQKVLSLAKTLKSKDWISAMKKETDRQAVVHLHNTLGKVLRMANQTNRED
jgi:ParB/RepB/Spo0J family partition protein